MFWMTWTGNELRGYVQNWRTHIASNDLLMIPFMHGKSQSYIHPANNPGQTCLYAGQRMVIDHLGISRVNKNILNQQELDWSQSLQFLVFLRHRPAHRMDPYQRFLTNHQGQPYNSIGSERISLGRFPVVLPYLQRKLFDLGLLWVIPTHQMF